jgi:hypothetical protein
MAENIVPMLTSVIGGLNGLEETEFGELTQSDFKVSLNEFDEEAGIGLKAQVLLAGPTLDKIKDDGKILYPNKEEEDMFAFISIKVSGDPNDLIEQIKGLIEAFGLPMDQLEAFGELKYHAGDGDVLIGFKAAGDHASMAKPFVLNTGVFGDGSQDVTMDLSFNLAQTWADLLDDEPIFSHILKGVSVHTKGGLHEKTRENVLKIISTLNDEASSPMASPLPFFMPLLFFKQVTGSVKLQCTDEMKEKIKDFATSIMPPALMSLKESFEMVKGMGLPLEMLQPVLELVQGAGVNEVSINGAANIGVKFTVRLPGLDTAIGEFLSG